LQRPWETGRGETNVRDTLYEQQPHRPSAAGRGGHLSPGVAEHYTYSGDGAYAPDDSRKRARTSYDPAARLPPGVGGPAPGYRGLLKTGFNSELDKLSSAAALLKRSLHCQPSRSLPAHQSAID